jgi:hypothetical protein
MNWWSKREGIAKCWRKLGKERILGQTRRTFGETKGTIRQRSSSKYLRRAARRARGNAEEWLNRANFCENFAIGCSEPGFGIYVVQRSLMTGSSGRILRIR